MYTTFAAKINAKRPRHLMNKTAQEIVEYMQIHFKADFYDEGKYWKDRPLNKSTAYLIAVSDALFNPEDWKAPFYAKFPDCGHEWAKAAVIWYHGAEAQETFSGAISPGYAC